MSAGSCRRTAFPFSNGSTKRSLLSRARQSSYTVPAAPTAAYTQGHRWRTLTPTHRMPADKFAIAMNMRLPRDIRVLYSEEAPEDFHARFSAKNKTYRYTVQCGPHADVFCRNTALHIHTPLDLGKMQAAAQDALGEHDFFAFMSAGSAVEHTVRMISRSDWSEDGQFFYYDVSANGFLYNMVRIPRRNHAGDWLRQTPAGCDRARHREQMPHGRGAQPPRRRDSRSCACSMQILIRTRCCVAYDRNG